MNNSRQSCRNTFQSTASPQRNRQYYQTQQVCMRSTNSDDACSCNDNCVSPSPISGYPLAMAYAPMQPFEDLFDPCTALSRGTVFERLDLPFCMACH